MHRFEEAGHAGDETAAAHCGEQDIDVGYLSCELDAAARLSGDQHCVAHAMNKLGVEGVVFVPERASSAKVDAIRRAKC